MTDEGASSTLFVGNLSGEVRYKDLIGLFKRYGEIEVSEAASLLVKSSEMKLTQSW